MNIRYRTLTNEFARCEEVNSERSLFNKYRFEKKRLDLILAVDPRSNGRGRSRAYRGGGRRRRRRRWQRRRRLRAGGGSGGPPAWPWGREEAARGGEADGGVDARLRRRNSAGLGGGARRISRTPASSRGARGGSRAFRLEAKRGRGLAIYRRSEAWARGKVERRVQGGLGVGRRRRTGEGLLLPCGRRKRTRGPPVGAPGRSKPRRRARERGSATTGMRRGAVSRLPRPFDVRPKGIGRGQRRASPGGSGSSRGGRGWPERRRRVAVALG